MLCQSVLLFLGEDKFVRQHIIPDYWLDFGVPACAWMVLLLKRDRHWMAGSSRFILRKAKLFNLPVYFGFTFAHYVLWYYIFWVSACRLLGGECAPLCVYARICACALYSVAVEGSGVMR